MPSGDPRPTIRNNNAKYKEETGHLKSRTVVSVPRPPTTKIYFHREDVAWRPHPPSKGSTNQRPRPPKSLSHRQILLKKEKWRAV